MSVCSIKYTYTRYAGVDIDKYTRGIFEYAKKAFRELQPQMSEPGYGTDMPDYLDILLFKKDGSNFCKTDIERRAVNIPRDYQLEGLVVEIHITNCDGTRHKKIHRMDGPDSDRILPSPRSQHQEQGASGAIKDLRLLQLLQDFSAVRNNGLHPRRTAYCRMSLLPYRLSNRRCLRLPHHQRIPKENEEEVVLKR